METTPSDLYAATAPYRLPCGPGMPEGLEYREAPLLPSLVYLGPVRWYLNDDARGAAEVEAILESHGMRWLANKRLRPNILKNQDDSWGLWLDRIRIQYFTGPTLLHAIAAAVEAVVKVKGKA